MCSAGEDLQYQKPGAERSRRRRGEDDDLDRYRMLDAISDVYCVMVVVSYNSFNYINNHVLFMLK